MSKERREIISSIVELATDRSKPIDERQIDLEMIIEATQQLQLIVK